MWSLDPSNLLLWLLWFYWAVFEWSSRLCVGLAADFQFARLFSSSPLSCCTIVELILMYLQRSVSLVLVFFCDLSFLLESVAFAIWLGSKCFLKQVANAVIKLFMWQEQLGSQKAATVVPELCRQCRCQAHLGGRKELEWFSWLVPASPESTGFTAASEEAEWLELCLRIPGRLNSWGWAGSPSLSLRGQFDILLEMGCWWISLFLVYSHLERNLSA